MLPHAWILGDDEFGRVPWFRDRLNAMGERYILDIPGQISACDAEDPPRTGGLGQPCKAAYIQVGRWKDAVAEREWTRVHVRDGIKGPVAVWATRARVRTKMQRKRRDVVE